MNIFNTLREKKDHIINKLNLENDQKSEIIEFFNRRPDLESKVDWNKKQELTWEFFQDFIKKANNQATRGNLKKQGIGTFIEGKDYFDISISDKYYALIPRTYEFQKFIQNKDFYGTEPSWCIGYQKSDDPWEDYNQTSDFIILIEKLENGVKIAWQITRNSNTFWNKKDNPFKNIALKEFNSEWKEAMQTEIDFCNSILDDLSILLQNFDKICTEKELSSADHYDEGTVLVTDKEGNGRLAIGPLTSKRIANASYRFEVEPYELNLSDLTMDVANNLGDVKNLYIPKGLTTIGQGCFGACKSLEKIIFNEGLEKIDAFAFEYCPNLKEVILPKDLVEVGRSAFKYCKFSKVFIPSSVMFLEKECFAENPNLEEIIFEEGIDIYNLPESFAMNSLALKEIKIPETVKLLKFQAFYSCKNLEKINLENVETFESYSLACTKLKHIKLRDATNICDAAFAHSALETIDLTECKNLDFLGDYAFSDLPKAKVIKLPKTLEELDLVAFANSNFEEIHLSRDTEVIETTKKLKTLDELLTNVQKAIRYYD